MAKSTGRERDLTTAQDRLWLGMKQLTEWSQLDASKKSPPKCLLHNTNIPVKVVAKDLFISLEVRSNIHLVRVSPPRAASHNIQIIPEIPDNGRGLKKWSTTIWEPVYLSLEFNYFVFFLALTIRALFSSSFGPLTVSYFIWHICCFIWS